MSPRINGVARRFGETREQILGFRSQDERAKPFGLVQNRIELALRGAWLLQHQQRLSQTHVALGREIHQPFPRALASELLQRSERCLRPALGDVDLRQAEPGGELDHPHFALRGDFEGSLIPRPRGLEISPVERVVAEDLLELRCQLVVLQLLRVPKRLVERLFRLVRLPSRDQGACLGEQEPCEPQPSLSGLAIRFDRLGMRVASRTISSLVLVKITDAVQLERDSALVTDFPAQIERLQVLADCGVVRSDPHMVLGQIVERVRNVPG